MTVLTGTIQERKDTAANWTSANPVLLSGEYGLETDTKKRKLGDGSTAWNSLAYYSDPLVELAANKSTDVNADQASNTKYPSVKATYDWAVGKFQNILTAATFGAFSSSLTGKTNPVDADTVNISDSAASGDAKKLTWANLKATLKTYYDTFYQTILSVASVSDINTGTDNVKYTTALGLEGSKYLGQVQAKISATASGTDTYTATLSPAIVAYGGIKVYINFTNANTVTTPTLALNGLTASTVVNADGTAISVGALKGIKLLAHDGTNFQLIGDGGGATANNQRVGNLFSDTFANSSLYTKTATSGSQTFGSGLVTLTGGNGLMTSNKMVYNYNSSGTGIFMDDFTVTQRFKPTANSTSFAIAFGIDISGQDSFAIMFNGAAVTNRGQVTIVNPNAGTTAIVTSAVNLSFTTNSDILEISYRWTVSKVIATVRNITTPTRNVSSVDIPNTVTVEYDHTPVSVPTPARAGRPCIYHLGGTQEVYSLSLDSDLFQNPTFVITGDSKVYGLGGSSYKNSYANLIGARSEKGMVWARGGAKVADLTGNISELGSIIKTEKTIVMIVVGVNDAIAARTLAQFQADYLALLQAIIALGAIPVPTKISYVANTVSGFATINTLIGTYNTWLGTLGLKVLDENTITNSAGVMNANLTSDGIHYIDGGQYVVASGFISQLSGLNITVPNPSSNGSVYNFPQAIRVGTGNTAGGTVTGTVFTGEGFGFNPTLTLNDNSTTAVYGIGFYQNTTNYLRLYRNNSSVAGNFTGTSIAKAGVGEIVGGSTYATPSFFGFSAHYFPCGQTTTNMGFNMTATGLRIATVANLHNAATAYLHLPAGTATASTAPLKFTSGTNLTTPENGAVEYDGTNYFVTSGSTRYTLAKTLTATATLDFGSTAASSSTDLTITVTGAADGDSVVVTPPNGSVVVNSIYTAWVSSANTVTVRFSNLDVLNAADPASGTFRAVVFKY